MYLQKDSVTQKDNATIPNHKDITDQLDLRQGE